MSTIIFLNGSSSAGKSSLAKAVQHLSDKPWLHFGIDSFTDMMSGKYVAFGEKARDGYYYFVPEENKNGPVMKIEDGPLGNKVFEAIPLVAKVLSDSGNDLIIDEVLFGDDILKQYVSCLFKHIVYFVGVHCDISKLQEREILRGNRSIGLANDQINHVHSGIREYDIVVDTSDDSSFSVGKNILSFMESTNFPQGFKKMYDIFGL